MMKWKPWLVFLLVCTTFCTGAWCAPRLPLPQPHPVPVLMMSDLHFDPFHDPAKVPALRAAPILQWSRILNDPDSVQQPASFAALQTACKARGEDSSWAVVRSSLEAAHSEQPAPLFTVVDGDLLAHNFDCRLRTLDPSITADGISEFAEKTVAFLALQYKQVFPHSPTYLALGNNDSGCSNYRQDANSAFVYAAVRSIAGDFSNPRDARQVLPAFSPRGDYSVLLPRAMHDTRLIVLQNVFNTPAYGACGGRADKDIVASQMDWLHRQLNAARKLHEKVWVMAHIPPGVDTYATFHRVYGKPAGMCPVGNPVMLQSSDELVQQLLQYAGTVRLAIFAHTHMDEIKLLQNTSGAAIPAKFIPSVSPVNGNKPSFLLASVQPAKAIMLDYTVYTAGDLQATRWSEAYRFSSAYHLPAFSADTVNQLSSRMLADRAGTQEDSATYQHWFFPGDEGHYAANIRSVWPAYSCALRRDGGAAYQGCVCPESSPAASSGSGQ